MSPNTPNNEGSSVSATCVSTGSRAMRRRPARKLVLQVRLPFRSFPSTRWPPRLLGATNGWYRELSNQATRNPRPHTSVESLFHQMRAQATIPIAAGASALATDCDAGPDPNGSRSFRDGRCSDVLGPNGIQDDHRSSQPRDLHLAHSRAGREHPSSGASARGLAGLAWASDVLDEPRNCGFRWLFRIRSGADDCSLAATEMVFRSNRIC